MPTKPQQYTAKQRNEILRNEIGYDQDNIFKNEEHNREGMSRLLGLKT